RSIAACEGCTSPLSAARSAYGVPPKPLIMCSRQEKRRAERTALWRIGRLSKVSALHNLERVIIMNDGVLLAIVFAGDHDAEFVINLEKDDRHHQRTGQIEGMVLSEGEVVRHRKAPVLRRGPPPLDRRRRVRGRPRSPRRRSRRGRTLA